MNEDARWGIWKTVLRRVLSIGLVGFVLACAPSTPTAPAPRTIYYGTPAPNAVGATAPTQPADVRLVGTGMVGPEVPHWPMFRHDSARTGRNGVARALPPTLKWSYTTRGEIWSSPAIGIDGTVYVGSLDKRVYAISETGEFKWAYETFGPIWSSPALAGDGTLYVASIDRNLYALRKNELK